MDEQLFDKTRWPDGPWKTEPDKRTLKVDALDVQLLRSPGQGHWMIYVGVPPSHHLFGLSLSDSLFVPLGVANANKDAAIENAYDNAADRGDERIRKVGHSFRTHTTIQNIWHEREETEDTVGEIIKQWYGFTLTAPGDRSPRDGRGGAYRDIAFAQKRAESLARQINAYANYRTRVGGPKIAERMVSANQVTEIGLRL